MKVEAIKKTQTKGILEKKNLSKWTEERTREVETI